MQMDSLCKPFSEQNTKPLTYFALYGITLPNISFMCHDKFHLEWTLISSTWRS